MNFPKDIFQYIAQEEQFYDTQAVEIFDNYSFQMKRHIQMSVSFKYGKYVNASNDYMSKPPFKNIVLPILRLRYRAQNVDVKDIVIYVDDPEKQYLSFLIKKYHDDVFVVENDIDMFLDRAVEESVDLGGCLAKKGKGAVPELERLQSIAFCDQTDILGGPIGFKFNFSPDKLREKVAQGWGNKKNGATITIDELIELAKKEKDPATTSPTLSNQVTGKNIQVYIVRGTMPESYLKEGGDEEKMVPQVQIVAFYNTKKNKNEEILYRAEDTEEVYKFHNPEEMFNRALGFGGVEELFDAQIWTNFAEIHKINMLKAASKNVFYTTDESFTNRNKIKELDNLEVTVIKEGAVINQVPTASPNIQLFTQAMQEWENHARETGGATDPLMGKQPPAGTPFRLQERVVFEGKGLHEYRIGKFAKFVEEIYRDWIIPQIAREIVKGKKFLSTLTSDEMEWIAEKVASRGAAEAQIEEILSGRIPENFDILKQRIRDSFFKGGNKRIIEIIKGEMKDIALNVKVDVAGQQKNLSLMVDKLVNVVRQYLATPQMLQDPVALKLLNRIFEASGISPIDLSFQQGGTPPQAQGVPAQSTLPIGGLSKPPAVLA